MKIDKVPNVSNFDGGFVEYSKNRDGELTYLISCYSKEGMSSGTVESGLVKDVDHLIYLQEHGIRLVQRKIKGE
jgi:hypothetical protein